MRPEDILPTYTRHAEGYARARSQSLFEKPWLDRILAAAPRHPSVLDLGCGPGLPIAKYLSKRGARVTGVDGAAPMLPLFRANLPGAETVQADMRELALGRRFDGIVAWDSVFHLTAADQRAMIPVFAAHAAPGAALMFTSGPRAGEVIGQVEGTPVYHASLDPDEYRAILAEDGFEVLRFVPDDPDCAGHSVWLARFTA